MKKRKLFYRRWEIAVLSGCIVETLVYDFDMESIMNLQN